MRITEYSVAHNVTTYVLIVIFVLGGLLAYSSLPRESAPEIEIPVIVVSTPYLGVAPEDIESLITNIMEREISEISDIKKLTSTSAEGVSIVVTEFDTETNLDEALAKIREKVDLAKADLPEDAEEPIVQEISTTDFPMMIVNVTGPYSELNLKNVAEDLEEAIENVQGVLEVRIAGGVEREFQVRIDLSRLNHYALTLDDVVNAVRAENINMPGGDVNVGDAKFLVRVPGEYKDAEQIANTVVRVRGGAPIFIRDIAEVRDTFKDRATYSRLDGRSNVSLTVTKRPGANIIEVSTAIRALVDELEAEMPASTEIVILSDESEDIRSMVKELENNMITGLLLVIAVIMFAMGFRNSVLVGLAIPLSMMITFLALQSLGITLNMIVLFSLILALGMLVDNGIVIVENIYRHASMGKSTTQAALEGTGEVAWPVATSTFTTVAAFFPLIFWPGVIGEFMGYLPKTLIVTLLASLLVALVITPVLCAAFLRVRPGTAATAQDADQLPKSDPSTLGGMILTSYEKLLRGAIGHRAITVSVGFVMLIATIALYSASGLGIEFFPETPPERIIVRVDAGDGTRVELTNRIVLAIEKQLEGNPNIEHYVATVGTAGGGEGGAGQSTVAHQGRVTIDFVDAEEQTEPVADVIAGIRERIADIPGARIEITKQQNGPPSGPPINVELRGDEFRQLEEVTTAIKAKIEAIDGVVDLKDDFASGRPEVRIEVDREKAGLVKATTSQIAGTVRTAINGTEASKIRDGEDEYDITVRLKENDRRSLNDLETLRIRVNDPDSIADANLVPIGEVAALVPSGGTGSIRHIEKERVVTISANAEGRLANDVVAEIQRTLKDFPLPDGFDLSYTGEQEDQAETQAFLGGAFLLALFLIALILVTQFNSVFIPAVIMLAVILSLIGVFWGQMIIGLPFGVIMTGLGVISLAGVVVNNAIVLVDYIQQLRQRGVPRDEALIHAGLVRLRPVLLTAITTVLGLVPMALKISIDFSAMSVQRGGSSSAFWFPMAIAVIFGLAIATVLTLVVVPTLYSLFDDFEGFLRRIAGSKTAEVSQVSGTGAPSPAPSARAPNV